MWPSCLLGFTSDTDAYDAVMPCLLSLACELVGVQFTTISAEAKQLVCMLMEMNPATRITAKAALSHDWIKWTR